MSAYVDTNVLVRHVAEDDGALSPRAARLLGRTGPLILTSTVFLETAHVLRSRYGYARDDVVTALHGILGLPSIAGDLELLASALEHHLVHRIDLPDALLVAHALRDGPPVIASFDRGLDRVPGLERLAP